MRTFSVSILLAVLAPLAAAAQPTEIEVAPLDCLPNQQNAAITARLTSVPSGGSVRLYFRRLKPEGAFYYNHLFAERDGGYWSVFPKPEDRDPTQLTDTWWQELAERDWMAGRDREWLEDWLRQQEHEAAEYYVSVHDATGNRLSQSSTALVRVEDPEDCPVQLSERELGWSMNLTIGETVAEQVGEQVHHWLCDGIVTRIGANGVLRADEFCRACVVAVIPPWLPPTAGALAAGLVVSELIEVDDEPPASPSRP